MYQRRIFAFLITFFYVVLLEAKSPLPAAHIDRIGLKEGLSNSEVRCIYQDKKGFIWFGTYDGLNRYDGYDFKIYRNQPGDGNSIIHSYVNSISEDQRHKLWVGTRQGISILDPLTDTFSPAYAPIAGGGKARVESYVKSIKTDGQGNVFVASEGNGLLVFKKGDRLAERLPFLNQGKKTYAYDVDAILVLPGNVVFATVVGQGICRLDLSAKVLRLLNGEVRAATCIYPDSGYLWIGTTTGLHRYNPGSGHFDRFLSEGSGGLKSNRITGLQAMPDGTLWVSTDGGGVQILDQERNLKSYLVEENGRGLSSNAVYALLLDKNGRQWIGTLRGGINVIDDVKDRFRNIQHDPLNSNSLISNFVKSLYEDKNGKLWIGTDGGGLSIWDRNNNSFLNFRHEAGITGSISSNFITGILRDKRGNMWITTYGGGINRFDEKTGQFRVYRGVDPAGKESRIVFWNVFLDSMGTLWASGLQDGLFFYDQATDKFQPYAAKLTNVLSICENNKGILWAGNFEGVYRLDRDSKLAAFYRIGKPVRAIHSKSDGNLWLGTEAGLMLFDTKHQKVAHQFTTLEGLSNNNVLSIEEDRMGKLWLSTYNGLCRFDPVAETFTNFFPSDGLASKEFNFNASLQLRDGQLAFGGIDGLTTFFPEQLTPLVKAPNLEFTDIGVDGQPLSMSKAKFLTDNQAKLVSITVPYEYASLNFRFAAIEFTAQERIRYRYMLQGWDRKWVDAQHQRNVLYTRLAPGQYTLRVNCTNPEGQWTSSELTLLVKVLPPWYASVWAFLAYAMLTVGLIYWFLRNRFRENKLKYEVKLASADAEYQRSLQEKEKELNERRIEFFTGVAHEFRTPLSLIINPIKDIISKSPKEDRQDLNTVFRNSRRLLSLVDQLLLFRKADAVSDVLHIGPMDISMVCKDVFLCFVQQAKLSGIRLELDATADPVIIYADREKIEIVLFNLISNAIKYSEVGKSVVVRLSEDLNDILIQVIDSGPGIPQDVGNRIFEKFYRSPKTGKVAGFGIGLYLARQFAERHKGTLDFESSPGIGTCFNLRLLKGAEHFSGIEVLEIAGISPLLEELNETGVKEPVLLDQLENPYQLQEILTVRKAVLVIDDDHDLRRYIHSILQGTYIVYEAENGTEGLELARSKQPDLIICDLMMPGLNGIEVCNAIKGDQELSYIPMILLTASASPDTKIKGLESGADDYIQKPFEKSILLARIANLLQNRDNLQQYFLNTITLKKPGVNVSEEYRQFLEKCIEIVEKHITEEEFSIKVFSAEIGMSHSNLYRKVKSLSGHTVNSFIRYIRLRKAAELLIHSDMNVNEVAVATGFGSMKYFRTQFFKLFGVNPSDFLKQKRPLFTKKYNVNN